MNAPGGTVREDYSPCGSSPTIMHARGFMVGTKIDLRQSATGTNSSALRWHCGTGVTKAAAHYALTIQPGETEVIRLRLAASEFRGENAFANFAKSSRSDSVKRTNSTPRSFLKIFRTTTRTLCARFRWHVVVQAVLPLCGQRLAGR